MLFLTVFCGFLAEYQLEHNIERDKVREFSNSFYYELSNDSITAELKVQKSIIQENALMYMTAYFQDIIQLQLIKKDKLI